MESHGLLLSDLPTEILSQICSTFCVHCSGYYDTWIDGSDKPGPWFAYGYRPDRSRPAIQTLRSLCFVSRRFCGVAQPFLYHAPPIENDDSEASWKLAKTFGSRPELAASIRLLPFLPRIAAMASVISQAVKLETLLVRPNNRLFYTQHWPRLFQLGNFPLLKEVVLNAGDYAFDRISYDDLLPTLIRAAPNVRTLDVHLTRAVLPPNQDFVLPSVTKLVVRCVYGRRGHPDALFEQLIHAFPNVHDFELHWLPKWAPSRFGSRNGVAFIPADQTPFHHVMTKGLARLKPQLRRLTLVAPTLRPRRFVKGLPAMGDGFKALEILALDAQTLDMDRNPKGFLQIPPSGVKEIWVYGFRHNVSDTHTVSDGYDDILDLPALKLKFPRLRRIGLADSPLVSEDLGAEGIRIGGSEIEVFRLPDWDRRM